MKLRIYPINIKLFLQTKSSLFGYFTFEPCECGCTKDSGWGFNFILFGINVVKKLQITTRK